MGIFFGHRVLATKWQPMVWIIDNFKPTQIITLLTTRYLQYLLARKLKYQLETKTCDVVFKAEKLN